jgi:catabolite regulation protein CreA
MPKDTYHNSEQDRRLCELEKKMDAVFDHIAVTNEEMGKVKTNVEWLKNNYWIVVSASVGAFITAVANIILR